MGIQYDFDGVTIDDVLKLVRTVKSEGVLKWLPEHLINYSVCLEAVNVNGLAIKHVPDRYLNSMLIETALTQNYKAYVYLDDANKKKYVKYVSKAIILELMNAPNLKWKY